MIRHYVLLVALLITPYAWGQSLIQLLPDKAMAAFGVEDLREALQPATPLLDAFEEMGVLEAFIQLSGESVADAPAPPITREQLLDTVGEEAWLALVANSQMFPDVFMLARPSDTFLSGLDLENTLSDIAQEQSSNGQTYWQISVPDEEMPFDAVFIAQQEGTVLLSSSADLLQNALQAIQTPPETPQIAQTLAPLGPGHFYSYVDYQQVAEALKPFGQGYGFDRLVNRIADAMVTSGIGASVMRLETDKLVSQTISLPNQQGNDRLLYKLMTSSRPADRSTASLTPATAITFSSAASDLQSWWVWLNDLAASVPQLGGSLDSFLGFFGVDLKQTFFSWVGGNVTTITTELGEVLEPGQVGQNLLGEAVYILPTKNDDQASEGLAAFTGALSRGLAIFGDPTGGAGNAESSTTTIAGIPVYSHDITSGVHLSYAVHKGNAFIATSINSLRTVLETSLGSSLSQTPVYTTLNSLAPENANALALSDAKASMESTAEQLASQMRLMAGVGGSLALGDFDTIEQASNIIADYLMIVAQKLGYSIGYGVTNQGASYSYSETTLDWDAE